ncbi:MAG: hypothetical protein PHO10_03105 [Gemmiger sp.]|nr:hypothetical protein [Gemmiger sp.]
MSLHGHTTIELTDRHGRRERVAHDNYIAGGVEAYFKPLGSVISAWELLSGARIADLFGSILLFDSTIAGDGATLWPGAANHCLGGADYGVTNTAGEDWRGNCNASESVIDTENRQATFVYDFATDQCNGSIGAICCAPQYSAAQAIFGVTGSRFESNAPRNHKQLNERRTLWTPYPQSYRQDTRQIVPVRMDFDDNLLWLVNTTTPNSYSLEKHAAPYNRASLFQSSQGGYTRLLQNTPFTLPQQNILLATSGRVLTAQGKLQVFGYPQTMLATDPIYLYTIDAGTGTVEGTVQIANPFATTPENIGFVLADGRAYLLFGGAGYTFPLSNPTDITAVDTSRMAGGAGMLPLFQIPGRVYMGEAKTNPTHAPYLLNTANQTVYRANFTVGRYAEGRLPMVEVKGHPLCRMELPPLNPGTGGGYLNNLRLFLSTVNNLDTPVVKTSDKTMKITYTIQETEG